MDEYIKKNALYKKIAQLEEFSRDRYLETPSDNLCRSRYLAELVERTYFKRIIADFPAEDVEPVRHGRWIEKQEKDTFAGYLYSYECSECGRVEQRKEPYCPKCGAKMDLED